MKTLLVVLVLLMSPAIILGVGCGGASSNPYGYDPAAPIGSTATPVGSNGGHGSAASVATPATWDELVQGDVSGVMPGVFRIANVAPGDTVDDWPDDNLLLGFYKGDPIAIVIYNAKSSPTPYSVTFALPHDPAAGYVAAPPEAARWVIIGDPMPIVSGQGTVVVPISLYIPKGAEVPDNWEFAIAVSEAQPPGNRLRAADVELKNAINSLGVPDVGELLNLINWDNMTDQFIVWGIASELTPPTNDLEGADYFVLTSGGRALEVYFTRELDDKVVQIANGDSVVVRGTLLRETMVRTEMRVRWLISMR